MKIFIYVIIFIIGLLVGLFLNFMKADGYLHVGNQSSKDGMYLELFKSIENKKKIKLLIKRIK